MRPDEPPSPDPWWTCALAAHPLPRLCDVEPPARPLCEALNADYGGRPLARTLYSCQGHRRGLVGIIRPYVAFVAVQSVAARVDRAVQHRARVLGARRVWWVSGHFSPTPYGGLMWSIEPNDSDLSGPFAGLFLRDAWGDLQGPLAEAVRASLVDHGGAYGGRGRCWEANAP